MTRSKGATAAQSQTTLECCMCGDYGLSSELFRCKVCQFRSQHRYCSNLYPKAESYRVCNWCLTQKDDTTEKTPNSSNSSSSHKSNNDDHDSKNKKKNSNSDNHGCLKGQRGTLQLQINSPIKKQKSPEQSPSARKRIITIASMEERIRRTKPEELSNGGITKQVFRNKTDISTKCSMVGSECVMDYTSKFTTHEIFQSRETLCNWCREVGKRNGFVIVIKSSDAGYNGRKARVLLVCERSSPYRKFSKNGSMSKKRLKRDTGTKKCGCPFALKGQKLDTDDNWMLKVVRGVHNHPVVQHLEGHSYRWPNTTDVFELPGPNTSW